MSAAPFPELSKPETQLEPSLMTGTTAAAAPQSSTSPSHQIPTPRESFSLASTTPTSQQPSSTMGASYQQQQSQVSPARHHPTTFNPFIYGNDVDSVDVATRIAMVYYAS